MSDLWTEASRDVEAEERELAYHRASAAMEGLWPWLAVARSEAELEHRKALAVESLGKIASESGMSLPEIGDMINRRYALVFEAMRKQAEEEEGGEWNIVDKQTGAQVAGPFESREEAAEKLESGDFGVPSSELTIEHEETEPEEGEGEEGEGKEASRHHALTEGENILAETVLPAPDTPEPEKLLEHDEEPDSAIPPQARNHIPDAVAKRRTAAEGTPPPPDGPPQPEEAEDPQQGPEDPGEFTGDQEAIPQTTKPRQMPGDSGSDSLGTSMEEESDPVGDQVDKVAEAVRKHNPHLPEVICRRVARKVIARQIKASGDDGIDYVNPEPDAQKHPGEEAAAGMAGRKVLDELPLLEV